MDIILFFGVILIISALSCKSTDKVGLPVLVGFILIGILIGNWYAFDSLADVNQICDFALLLIIFTGGFQTDFNAARRVLGLSAALSAAGTVITALLAGAFAYYVMGLAFYQAMLLGAVISSTDAASVFSVLRSKNMRLARDLEAVLEIESGSNDPFAHMLTVVFLSLAAGHSQNVALLIAVQICVGALSGVVFAKLGQFLINRLNVDIDGVYGVLLCGTAFLIYGAANQIGGNGFLAVYVGGIIIGNSRLMYKGFLSRLFSTFSLLMQILLFIILGIMCLPSAMLPVVGSGLLFAMVLLFVIRPVVMFALMKPFRRSVNEIALVSWAGFRGASSIVFATHVLAAGLPYAEYVFSVVFLVCMLSVVIQGTFILPIAKKLKLAEE